MTTTLPDYNAPDGLHPLLAGILSTTHDRHADMIALLRDLPNEGLVWRPGPEMSSLAGLVRHMMDDETEFVRSLAGQESGWPGVNGEFMDATGSADELVGIIIEGDTLLKRVYAKLTVEHLRAPHPSSGAPVGRELVELADHAAMHYGHMQLIRHLYEQTHPDFQSAYAHWR